MVFAAWDTCSSSYLRASSSFSSRFVGLFLFPRTEVSTRWGEPDHPIRRMICVKSPSRFELPVASGHCLAVAAIIASTAFAALSSDLDRSTNP